MIVRQLETRLTAGDNAPQSLSNIKNAIQSMAELYLDAKGPGAWRLRWFWMFFFIRFYGCEMWVVTFYRNPIVSGCELGVDRLARLWHLDSSEQLFWIPHHCHVQGCCWPSEWKIPKKMLWKWWNSPWSQEIMIQFEYWILFSSMIVS